MSDTLDQILALLEKIDERDEETAARLKTIEGGVNETGLEVDNLIETSAAHTTILRDLVGWAVRTNKMVTAHSEWHEQQEIDLKFGR